MPLDAHDLARIESLFQKAVGAARPPSAILTRDEAVPYTKNESLTAFYRWCRRWSVKSVTNGRYSRPQLDRALDRESRKARFATKRPSALKRAA